MNAPNALIGKRVETACILGEGCPDKKGYIRVRHRGRRMWFAHRAVWAEFYGPIPEGLCVLHHCDVPPCVRPDHLWLGTQADNMRDAAAKKRTALGAKNGTRLHPEKLVRGDNHHSRLHPEKVARGERQGGAKLTSREVINMRRLRTEGMTVTALGRLFGVSLACASRAVNGKTWAHVTEVANERRD